MADNSIETRRQTEAQLIGRAQQDVAFRQALVADPKAVFARELGVMVPDSIHVEVLEETSNRVYLVLPQHAASPGTELSDTELEDVAGGVWTDVPVPPDQCVISCAAS